MQPFADTEADWLLFQLRLPSLALMSSSLRVRVRGPSGAVHSLTLEPPLSLAELRCRVQQLTAVPPSRQSLLVGFPPRPLLSLDSNSLRAGDTLIVQQTPADTDSRQQQQQQPQQLQQPALSSSPSSSSSSSRPPPLVVRSIPDDNSCLFHALSVCVGGRCSPRFSGSASRWTPLSESAASLRQLSASLLLSVASAPSQAPFLAPFLSSIPSLPEYAEAIAHSSMWGGGLECAVLSAALGVVIVAVDVLSLRPFVFGGEQQRAVFLLYSGCHYDALTDDDGATVFSSADEWARLRAVQAAREARQAHRYVDLQTLSLRCAQCGGRLRGQQEANVHAKETQHTHYTEYAEPHTLQPAAS